MLVTLFGIVIDVSPVQPENAPLPMLVTASGIVIEVRLEHPEYAEFPMFSVPSTTTTFVMDAQDAGKTDERLNCPGMMTSFTPEQYEKAMSPMVVTLSGIVIVDNA